MTDPAAALEPASLRGLTEAALDETLEGTMDASDAPSTIPDPAIARDEAEHDRAEKSRPQ